MADTHQYNSAFMYVKVYVHAHASVSVCIYIRANSYVCAMPVLSPFKWINVLKTNATVLTTITPYLSEFILTLTNLKLMWQLEDKISSRRECDFSERQIKILCNPIQLRKQLTSSTDENEISTYGV